MVIQCPRCGRALQEADVVRARNIGACTCGEMFTLPTDGSSTFTAPVEARLTPPSPSDGSIGGLNELTWKERPTGDGVEIATGGKKSGGVGLVVFGILWNAFFLWFGSRSWNTGNGVKFTIVLGIVMGALVIYAGLGTLFAMPTITIGRSGVRVKIGPIPGRDNFSVPLVAIERFGTGGMPTVRSLRVHLVGGRTQSIYLNVANDGAVEFAAKRLNELLDSARQPPHPRTYRG